MLGREDPRGLHTPLRDGDTDRPEDENYKNSYFINANSRNKPGIIDRARREIEDETEVYSGCYAKVTLDMFPYSQSGNRGVGCGLGNILKWQDGEPLGGRVRPEADFDDEEFDEYDADDDLLG